MRRVKSIKDGRMSFIVDVFREELLKIQNQIVCSVVNTAGRNSSSEVWSLKFETQSPVLAKISMH